MLDKWRSFRDTVDDTTSTIRSIFWMVGVVAVIILIIREWLESLDTIQTIAIWIALVCLGVILLTYFLDWQRKRNVDKIPELLANLDKLTLDYIDNYAISSPEGLVDDLASLFNMNIGELKAASHSGSKKRAELAFQDFTARYERYHNSKKFQDNIMSLRLAGGLMNEYHVGLASITNTKDYQRLYERIKYLRRRLPSAYIATRVNEYFHQSEALYSMLLSVKPFENLGDLKSLISAKTRAHTEVIHSIVEDYVGTLISAVRESIDDYKQKNKPHEEKSKRK